MTQNTRESEFQMLKDSLMDIEKSLDETLQRVQNKLETFMEQFKSIRNAISYDMDDFRNKENSRLSVNTSFVKTESMIEENNSTPDKSINNRYPRYISPSIRNNTCKSIKPFGFLASQDCDIFMEKNIDKLLTIQAYSRGHLCREVYKSDSVSPLVDLIGESGNLLKNMENDCSTSSFVDQEFKDRLLMEIDMAKSKISSIFFEYTTCQQICLIHQKKQKCTPTKMIPNFKNYKTNQESNQKRSTPRSNNKSAVSVLRHKKHVN